MSRSLNIVLIGAGLLSLSAGAMAQLSAREQASGKTAPVTRAQLQTKLEQRFDRADANHDGTLTQQERVAFRTDRKAERHDALRERMFARLDADGNGAISREEFSAARPPRGRDGAMMHGRHRSNERGAAAMRQQRFASADQSITKSDYVDNRLSRFDRVDTNHDGTISPAERDAARKAKRDRFAPAQMPSPPPPGS